MQLAWRAAPAEWRVLSNRPQEICPLLWLSHRRPTSAVKYIRCMGDGSPWFGGRAGTACCYGNREASVGDGLEFGATALMFSNKHFDPVAGSRLYNEYLERCILADELGIDGIMLNEHHNAPFCGRAAGAGGRREHRCQRPRGAGPCRHAPTSSPRPSLLPPRTARSSCSAIPCRPGTTLCSCRKSCR